MGTGYGLGVTVSTALAQAGSSTTLQGTTTSTLTSTGSDGSCASCGTVEHGVRPEDEEALERLLPAKASDGRLVETEELHEGDLSL